jgi:phage gp45-like
VTTRELIDAIRKVVAPIDRRVRLMVSRGVIKKVQDSGKLQTLQLELLADEIKDAVERFQQYGFTSYPKVNAEVLFVAVGGARDHGVVVAVDDRRYRPKTLSEGESALYTAQNGIRVLCKADGKVELGSSPSDFVSLATLVANAFNVHAHPSPMGPVGAPIVQWTAATTAASEVKGK